MSLLGTQVFANPSTPCWVPAGGGGGGPTGPTGSIGPTGPAGGGGGGSGLVSQQDFAVPMTAYVLATSGTPAAIFPSTISVTPTTDKLVVNAMICLAEGGGGGDIVTFGIADATSPSSPLLFTKSSIGSTEIITMSLTGVIPVTAGVPRSFVLVGCVAASTFVAVNDCYAVNIVG